METSSLNKDSMILINIEQSIKITEEFISETKTRIEGLKRKVESLEGRLKELKELESEYISNMSEN